LKAEHQFSIFSLQRSAFTVHLVVAVRHVVAIVPIETSAPHSRDAP
jgi:hypothetical protein